jgi:ParB family chromosome partitioning protein
MPLKTSGNLALTGFDDIFSASGLLKEGEVIVEILLTELFPPEFHPFQVNDDPAMQRLARNIKNRGVRRPGVARVRAEGAGTSGAGYELLCGNRRKRACEIAGLAAMPVIIRNLTDDEAVIEMVDDNLEHREKILPSEKAWAYRVKLEALNHNGVKADMDSVDILAEQTGESKTNIYRIVHLTELVPDLLDKVDAKKLALNPAVELSYLSRAEQNAVIDAMAKYEVKPSLSQAVRLKKARQTGTLTLEMIDEVLGEDKKPADKKSVEISRYARFFPKEYTSKQMDAVITKLLMEWKGKVAV